nr:MAG TPA: hypothetical protein [Caudoviricetes sp.]
MTINEIIKEKGISIVKRVSNSGSISLSLRHKKQQESKEGKPYSQMRAFFNRIDAEAKAEKSKAKDMDYSDKDKKPVFEMKNGILRYVKGESK